MGQAAPQTCSRGSRRLGRHAFAKGQFALGLPEYDGVLISDLGELAVLPWAESAGSAAEQGGQHT